MSMSNELKYHPAANAFPLMERAAFSELKSSIEERGLREPIVLLDGMILDGRNRYRACVELGIPPRFTEYKGTDSPWMWVWDENAERRHLQSGTKAAIRLDIEEGDKEWQAAQAKLKREANKKRSKAAKKQQRNESGDFVGGSGSPLTTTAKRAHKTRKARAKAAGTSSGTMAKAETVKKNAPDLHDAVKAGKKSLEAAYKELQARNKAKQQAEALAKVDELPKRVEACDFREFIERERPSIVITDPPYPYEFVGLYGQMAEVCARSGVKVLAAMAGQSYLPRIMHEMAEHMPYRWTIAYLTPGGQAVQLWGRKVNTSWKPVIVMGETPEGWMGDVAKSAVNNNDKAHHHWGQSESGMIDLIKRLSEPGDTICDPFCGAGTTGVAALLCGRGFIGCDVDPEHVEKTKERLAL